MKFWLYVNNEKHSFVEGDRVPQVGETLLFRDAVSSTLEEATVKKVIAEIMGGKSDIANPVGMIYHVYTQTPR